MVFCATIFFSSSNQQQQTVTHMYEQNWGHFWLSIFHAKHLQFNSSSPCSQSGSPSHFQVLWMQVLLSEHWNSSAPHLTTPAKHQCVHSQFSAPGTMMTTQNKTDIITPYCNSDQEKQNLSWWQQKGEEEEEKKNERCKVKGRTAVGI